jgi:predicted GNAT family N-acyltransferase
VHALAQFAENTSPIGTARLLPDGHIGRMAVLRDWRRYRAGRAMLDALLERARAGGHREAIVNAQIYITAFYAQAGFSVTSDPFDEAGIPHVEMRRAF